MEAARRHGVRRFIGASSCAVYGDGLENPKREDMPLMPLSPYALQKLASEQHARLYRRLYGLETLFLRYFNVYGPRQDPSSPYSGVISIFLNQAMAGLAPVIYDDGRQYRDFVFVHDVVQSNLLAAAVPIDDDHELNIGTGEFVRIHDLWLAVQRLTGAAVEPVFQPPRPGEIRESVADIQRARDRLGFTPGLYQSIRALKTTLQ